MKVYQFKIFLFFFFFAVIAFSALFLSKFPIFAITTRDVVISEIAWSGTIVSSNHEWIELYNNTDVDIDLTGWTLKALDGTPSITLFGTISAKTYFLLERTSENTTSVDKNQIYTGALNDSGESLELSTRDGVLIDTANSSGGAWPAGADRTGTPMRGSMERSDLLAEDTDDNWVTNDGIIRNGLDANGSPINGTPKSQNSQGFISPSPSPTPSSTPVSTPSNSPTPTPTQSGPTKTPTPKKTSTPKLTATLKPTVTQKYSFVSNANTLTPTKLIIESIQKESELSKEVLGQKNKEINFLTKTPTATETPKIKTEVLGTSQSNILSKILISLGSVFIVACVILAIRAYKKKYEQ